MLTRLGHRVIHYGHVDSRVEAAEHVSIMSNADLDHAYPGWDWHTQGPPSYRFTDSAFIAFTGRAIAAIAARKQPGDFLLCPFPAHAPIAAAHPNMIVVESGVGYYEGHFAPHKAFESYACMHVYQGLRGINQMDRELGQHVVIPNAYDLAEFEYRRDKDDYLLFMGRVTRAKGIDIAVEVAEQAGRRLVVAGPLDRAGRSGGGYRLPRRAEYVGIAGLDQRRELLAGAAAILCPSRFVEPFCGLHIEGMLSGTPAITSDWGAFAEYNLHRETGFRCRNLAQFIEAVDRLDEIDPARCREWAESRFAMDVVARQYERFLSGIDR